jgi:hypothetical protein
VLVRNLAAFRLYKSTQDQAMGDYDLEQIFSDGRGKMKPETSVSADLNETRLILRHRGPPPCATLDYAVRDSGRWSPACWCSGWMYSR